MQQLDLDWTAVVAERDRVLEQVERSAGPQFASDAAAFVERFLSTRPEGASAERITDACKAEGIVPHDDRAFGPVYMRLARRGIIEKVRHVARAKGHGTAGGNVWRRVSR